jgi:hypothetical protein
VSREEDGVEEEEDEVEEGGGVEEDEDKEGAGMAPEENAEDAKEEAAAKEKAFGSGPDPDDTVSGSVGTAR